MVYIWSKMTLPHRDRRRFTPTGIFPMLQTLFEAIYHTRKANLCEKWRCRFAAGGVSRRQPFFQCFKLCLKLFTIHARPTFVKNGVAALRQEAVRADRHFSNASNSV
jgi:hypothetical protein